MKRLTPVEAVGRGVAAGVLGTGLMTAWQELAAKIRSASKDVDQPPPDPSEDPWQDASAPAKVAKRISERAFHKDVSPQLIPLLTNAMHWGYGTGWGALYGLAAASDIPAIPPAPGDHHCHEREPQRLIRISPSDQDQTIVQARAKSLDRRSEPHDHYQHLFLRDAWQAVARMSNRL